MYGLVLEGGGGKGGYHIGVWKALRELNIEIGAVTGSSTGALNGAFIAQNAFGKAYDLWYNMDTSLVINVDTEIYNNLINFTFDYKNRDKYFDYVKSVLKDRGLDVEPLKELIKLNLDEELIRNSPIEFGLVTVSITDRKPLELFVDEIPIGKLHDYLLASAYLPTFKSMVIDNKKFIDGAFYDNLPINLIYKRGYKNIIAVEMKSLGLKRSVKAKDINIITIEPSGDLGMVLEFDAEKSRKNIQMGYLDTLKVFGKYEGDKYFFENVPDESYFIRYLLNLRDEQINEMAMEIGLAEGSSKRLLFEGIIPEFAKLFGVDMQYSYKDIVIRFFEHLALRLDVERLMVYSFEQFKDIIFEKMERVDTNIIDHHKIPSFLKKTYLVKYSLKEDILLKWAKIIVRLDK